MNVQETEFPSDHYNEMGKLRKYLMKALNRADSSVTAAKVLASTLAFTASKLREVYQEDGIKSKAQEKRDAKAEKEKKSKVSKPKPKTKK
jgi:hypothetical protein